MMTLDDIRELAPEEAIINLDLFIESNPEDDSAYLLRGLRHWSCGHRAEAMRDYLEAIRLNPDSKARQALQTAQEILDFRNTDLLNP